MFKNRCFLLMFVLLLSVSLLGCGKTQSAAPTAEPTPEAAIDPTEAPAPDPKAEAMAAYRALLEAAPMLEGEHEEMMDATFGYEQDLEKYGKHIDVFALTDLDSDGIPELIATSIVNFRFVPVSVYTYADGEAVLLLLLSDPLDPQSPVTFTQYSAASGTYTLYFCEENHIHTLWRGDTPVGEMTEDSAYALEDTTLVPKDCSVGENGNVVYFSELGMENSAENRAALGQ